MINKTYTKLHFEPGFTSWGDIEGEEISSPAKHKINIFNADFSKPGNNASEVMWFYSLGWLAKYSALENSDHQVITRYLIEFLKGLENKSLDKIYKILSFDHCAASRIRYLCMIYANFFDNTSIKSIITAILRKELAWFSSLTGVACNNHGMMLCVSIFHAALILDKSSFSNELNTSLKWLKNILDSVIPKNGYVLENTIGYHDFYYKYLKKQLEFFNEYYHDIEIYDYLYDIYIRVEIALYKVVTPNGNIPPLGQCGFYPTKYRSILGTHHFKEQGFLVKKDDENYFSYTCGSSSLVHKQLDNTSIYLTLSGHEIFIDSGLGNYNEKESKSVVVNGQRGHSGAFFRALDNEQRNLFLNSNSLKNVESSIDVNCDIISSKTGFDFNGNKYLISRDIEFNSFKSFNILDKFISDNQYGFPVSRFIVPNDTQIKIKSNVIFLEYANYYVSMEVKSSFSYSFRTGVDDNEEVEFSAGWRSRSFNKFEKCKVIEIYPSLNELNICITIDDKK